MELQLKLLPYHYYYYNALGFDPELIDYIDHVDDSIVLEKILPLYKDGGRPPIDPRVCGCIIYTSPIRKLLRFRN
ncbi:hypothetical protein [Paenibacillus macquariensis]|uniref:Transposase n=1 Tax=Paenibacillus macquariensis TaxID=948756 RepID=A0ABY1K2L5_9BACL|nr:hypothetical protein [Paenibacillus macquariensis]MEC0090218.1 hypothetical protein [Paenibacillus macquariensis]OAB39587.1 hypothetical protein PMSM_00190 [Paenibacillus macquariensis subsp. macquariensis]SIR17549.1 hypothetical protein SAMN05421578_10842 [Paenibacillus macquariensis]